MKLARTKWWSTLVILCLCYSCQSANQKIDTRILDLFSDYAYVGSGPVKFHSDGILDTTTISSHTSNEHPKPKKIEINVQYIFHHLAPVDNEMLALQVLPAKLSQMGYKVTRVPKHLTYLFAGGPLFRIEFSDGKHEGVVFNQLDMQAGAPWTTHDYVLVYTR